MVMTRIRYARHPVVVGLFAGMVIVTISQLLFGPQGSKVVLDMAGWSQLFFASLLLGSSIGCIASAMIHRPILGAHVERASMFGVSVALGFYSVTAKSSVASWNTSMAVVFACVAIGAAIRAGIVWRLIRRHRAVTS